MNEEPVDVGALRVEIARTARTDDLAERTLEIIAILESVAAPLDIHPVVIGEMAVYFWTERDEFVELGFMRGPDGRHWSLKGTDILLEAPTSHLDSDAEFFEVTSYARVEGRRFSRVWTYLWIAWMSSRPPDIKRPHSKRLPCSPIYPMR